MTDGITAIFGAGVLLFLLLYIAFSIEPKHKYLRLFIIGMVFLGLVSIPKFMLDNDNYCDIVVSGANTTVTDYTTYDYERVCFDNDSGTAEVTFVTTTWILIVFFVYLWLYFLYEMFYVKIQQFTNKFKRGRKKP